MLECNSILLNRTFKQSTKTLVQITWVSLPAIQSQNFPRSTSPFNNSNIKLFDIVLFKLLLPSTKSIGYLEAYLLVYNHNKIISITSSPHTLNIQQIMLNKNMWGLFFDTNKKPNFFYREARYTISCSDYESKDKTFLFLDSPVFCVFFYLLFLDVNMIRLILYTPNWYTSFIHSFI